MTLMGAWEFILNNKIDELILFKDSGFDVDGSVTFLQRIIDSKDTRDSVELI